MKTLKTLLTAAILFAATFTYAQAPDGFNYQAVIRDGSGNLVTSGTVKLQFSINESTASGTTVYQETHDVTPNAYGLVTATIGGGTVVSGTFSGVDWSGNDNYLKVEADPAGGTSYVSLGTTQFMSVPYAKYAQSAGSGGGSQWSSGSGQIYYNNGGVQIGGNGPLGNNGLLQLYDPSGDQGRLNIMSATAPSVAFYEPGETAFATIEGENSGVGAGDLVFKTDNGSTHAEQMRITSEGNVGIGEMNPTHKLDIISPGDQGLQILSDNANAFTYLSVGRTTSEAQIGICTAGNFFQNSQDGDMAIKNFDSGKILFGASFNTNAAMAITTTGNVGIATVSPGYKLEVNGTAAKSGGGSWTASSDARLKKDVNAYIDGLQQLLSINPVKFHYNEKSGHDTKPEYVGVIAQELIEITPYMVGTFEMDGVEYYNVDNSAMTYMLINAVKEQQAQIENLKAENTNLKTEFKADIDLIKAQLGLNLQGKK